MPHWEGSEHVTATETAPAAVRKRTSRGNAAGEVIETISIAILLFFAMRLLVLPVKVEGYEHGAEPRPRSST